MNKVEIDKKLKELVRNSIGMEDSPKSDYLRNGIKEISKEIEADIESTNDKIVGNLALNINVDSSEAQEGIRLLNNRLDFINQQIDRAVEELEGMKNNIKIGVEVDE
ncbi:hypothetical protein [Halanaerobium salsuginis]|uniref:Uncharacterized protein n=1 Tax=Halanaerobium salsuginis TaxID=29563 RepID=A0A1I4F172_9FIRM|nr:hypothetical protein [Halanaerobium salsuginis]SFL10131.1 hypothetical protein SAMN02983006_00191 [Halanaerobium salsuginis]